MSKASEWADVARRAAAAKREVRRTGHLPLWHSASGLVWASVTDDGGLEIHERQHDGTSRSVSAWEPDALTLARWILDTFGEDA